MLSLPKDVANKSFKDAITSTGKDYQRLNRIARVGVKAGSIWSQRTFQVNCLVLVKHARWLQEMSLLSICC